jgi:hypothetical protein
VSILVKRVIAVNVISILLFIFANYIVLISVNRPTEIQGWNPLFITTLTFPQYSGNGPSPQVVVLSYVPNFPFYVFWFAIAGNLLCILPTKGSSRETQTMRKVKQVVNANLAGVAVYVFYNILLWMFFFGLRNTAVTNYSLLSISTNANSSFPMLPFYAFWLAIAVNLYYLCYKNPTRQNKTTQKSYFVKHSAVHDIMC